MDIAIQYSDKHLVIVNKPHDLLSVPGKGPDKRDCVQRRVHEHFPTARIVHRLDCATSGLMVLALDADSHRELSRQFHDREVSKAYIACVYGELRDDEGEVKAPLITDWPRRPRQKIDPSGKSAHTCFKVIAREGTHTRVQLMPVTGRSHQLRVHMQSLGHPILGDAFYAEGDALAASSRLCLHATALGFSHPDTGQRMEFISHAPF
ncbi:MAG: RluA family pseudouridine synthase [Oleiphilaceae bacterium]|nr:RluA family pseudouridine synthase [Oleiphilaceae bacterium]